MVSYFLTSKAGQIITGMLSLTSLNDLLGSDYQGRQNYKRYTYLDYLNGLLRVSKMPGHTDARPCKKFLEFAHKFNFLTQNYKNWVFVKHLVQFCKLI